LLSASSPATAAAATARTLASTPAPGFVTALPSAILSAQAVLPPTARGLRKPARLKAPECAGFATLGIATASKTAHLVSAAITGCGLVGRKPIDRGLIRDLPIHGLSRTIRGLGGLILWQLPAWIRERRVAE